MHTELPPLVAFVLALAELPDMGPARLSALTDGRDPGDVWTDVCAGRASDGPHVTTMGADPRQLAERWRRAAASIDPHVELQRHVDAGIGIAWREDDVYPSVLRSDPHAPALLFWRGDLTELDGPRVAIVGTRDCTHAGRAFATQLGRELAEVGVRVVSGLALGIDGAAHAGVLSVSGGPPVGVVGSGLDVVYPRRHTELWERVATAGVLLTEHPLGAKPVGWHFLARNRIIAILAEVVVVVESHASGGALQTATEAGQRGRTVLVVPGSTQSVASEGTNALLRDGCGVCCDTTDVLTALGLSGVRRPRPDARPAPSSTGEAVLRAMGGEPCSLEQIMLRSSLGLGDLVAELDRLETDGWIVRRGAWCERVGPR